MSYAYNEESSKLHGGRRRLDKHVLSSLVAGSGGGDDKGEFDDSVTQCCVLSRTE